MRLSSFVIITSVFAAAAGLSVFAAQFSVRAIETASRAAVLNALDREGLTWAAVDTDGLQVFLIGTAPDEATRFEALTAAGSVVDAARVIDNMLVEEPEDLAPPRFSLEILRNDAGISVIGLVPVSTDRAALIDLFTDLAGDGEVTDLLESADFPAPDHWDATLRYATAALGDLPRAKISVEAGRVAIKATADSAQAKRRLESDLARRAPDAVRLALEIAAPRPVISPFTLRFRLDADGARFDACSADTAEARDRILGAAAQAGLQGKATCTLGLGVPSRRWADAVTLTIAKLDDLGGGTVTFTNADIALIAPEGTDQAQFDRIVGELEAELPPVFALTAVRPEPQQAGPEEAPEFTATLSPEGKVQLRGRVSGGTARVTTESYARASFGSADVYMAARVDEDLPTDWSIRVLAALEALSMLHQGSVTVTQDLVVVRGRTGGQDTGSEVSRLLVDKLGEDASFDIDIAYDERLDPELGIPTPEECEAQIVQTIGDRKITFEPGSATLDASAKDILDEIADLLKLCGDIPLEIGGHTDSQGREVMNEALSRDRAQSVLDALQDRQVLVASYTVRGYGETQPIADNDTEEGREANRRIEFRLIRDDSDDAPYGTTAEAGAETAAEGDDADGQN